MAISALDEEAGLVRLLHVLSPLPPAVAAARLTGRHAPVPKAESLSSVAGSTFAREKNWGLLEDGGELLLFYTLLPCTVVLSYDLTLGNATALAATARAESRACFGGAAAAIARHTGAQRGAARAQVAQTCGGPGCIAVHILHVLQCGHRAWFVHQFTLSTPCSEGYRVHHGCQIFWAGG